MATEVYMDIPQVQKLVSTFKNFASILKNVNKVLEVLSTSLKITAWFSFGATAAAAAFIERIKPNVKKMADKMDELSDDIKSAIEKYVTGDSQGSDRFC
jgi:P2-related tail formation protein